ncbi:hypothetical protein N7520_005270 [Penicillium odoratum]|uniref:uncharacterized protein n=1 Tax=Penicillium odoratum TaxID=1167516 RepID=UPI002546D8CD|nr:uncharacterized protein N7520_005270 [Penicillium odoratum]KAJ5765711.1 hypothetical protein N7520_005270 [Penicillium odoratum]
MEPRKPRGIKKRVTEAEYENRKANIAAQSVKSTPGTKSIKSASPTRSATPSIYTPSVAIPLAEPVGSKLAFMSLPPFNTPEVPENVDKKLPVQPVPASKSTLRATAPIFVPQAILQKRIMESLDPALESPSMRKVPVAKLHGDLIDFESPATAPAPMIAEFLRLELETPSPAPTPQRVFTAASDESSPDPPSPNREDFLAGCRHICKCKGCVAKEKARSIAPETPKWFPDLSLPNYPFMFEDQSNFNEFETELPEILHLVNQYPIKGKEREVKRPEPSTMHFTMNQKSGRNPLQKGHTEPKTVIEARHNALISMAWGEQEILSLPGPSKARSQENSKTTQRKNRQAAEKADQIRYLFRTICPLLDAATSYPGILNVEIQIGLLLLYRSPNSDKMGHMTVKELEVFFDPNVELPPPFMKFFGRLTSSPADIDHIINLEVEGSRLFEAEPTDGIFEYEFHCSIGEERFLVVIDQSQMTTVPKSPVPIGSVYLNVPGNVWDASLTIYGSVGQFTKTSREARQAATEISQNLSVAPNRTHVRLVLKRSDDFKIVKVLLRRTTTHRHIRTNYPDKDSEIYLHVKETQDLIISINNSEKVIAAHCAPLKEMVKASRQWWSVSLTSKILDTVLRSNLKLELGDKATEWKPMSLFGDDFVHLSPKVSRPSSLDLHVPLTESDVSSETTISSSIGNAGLGALVSLAENVVKVIDFVGANNLRSSMNVDNTEGATNPVVRSDSQKGISSDSRALVLATKPFQGSVRW